MTNLELIDKLKQLVDLNDTVYLYGGWGQVVTKSVINAKAKQLPTWYTKDRINTLMNNIGKYGFDCVNMIKSILWDFSFDKTKKNGGAKYKSNQVPDTNANGFFALCTKKSTDFSNIKVGCAVHIDGHIGVYIGGGKVVECTYRWKNGVQITSLANLKYFGNTSRFWDSYGYIPFIDYVTPTEESNLIPLKVGDKVEIINTMVEGKGLYSTTYDNRRFRLWYTNYTVMGIEKDRVIIGKTGTITCAINISNLRRLEE